MPKQIFKSVFSLFNKRRFNFSFNVPVVAIFVSHCHRCFPLSAVSTQVEIQIFDVFADALCVSFSLEAPLMLTSEILNRLLFTHANIAWF